MELKNRFLQLLRKTNTGKIETAVIFGRLIMVQGWTSRENIKLKIDFKNQQSVYSTVQTKPTNRDDLKEIEIPVFEFATTLNLAGHTDNRARIGIDPKVRFQRNFAIDSASASKRQDAISRFGLQTLVENRNALDKVNTKELGSATSEEIFYEICELMEERGSEVSALVILLRAADSNSIHSQLLLLELSNVAIKKVQILILTDTELSDFHTFSWSQLFRENDVKIGTLQAASPSELAMTFKQYFPKLRVVLIRQGENLLSLAGILTDLDLIDKDFPGETVMLRKTTSSTRDSGAAIVLGDNIPQMVYPRVPLNDWDFVELCHAIGSAQIVKTDSLAGRQTSTFDSISIEVAKQIEEHK